MDSRDIKKIHEQKAREQYLKDAQALFDKINTHHADKVETLRNFSLANVKDLLSLTEKINEETNIKEKEELYQKYKILLDKFDKIYQQTISLNEIFNANYQSGFAVHEELKKIKIRSISY